jgi:sugar lactone lactonase YvrE
VSPGSYTGAVRVQTTVKGVVISQSVPITLNKEGHWLYVSAQGAAFSSFPSRSVLTRTLQVTSSQNRTDVPWTATSDQSWMSVTASGLTGGSLILTANPAGLQADQEYIANLTISSSDGSILNTQSVRVGLWVGSTDPGDVTISGSFPNIAASPVEPYVYASDGGSHVFVYQVYSGSVVRTLTTSLAQTAEIAVSADGTQLFVSDATNLEVVAIDPTTGATIRHFPWGASNSGGVAYARPGAHPILLLGDGAIYNVSTGAKYQATLGAGWYGGSVSFAVDPSSKYLYAQDLGLSPSTLTQYALTYSALSADGLTVTPGPATSGGSNGQDICVSADGSKVYTANGAPYDFPAFNTNGLQPAQTLSGVPYPDNAECGWNGLFVGGAAAYYNATDVWVYRPDGTLVTTLSMHPAYLNNLLRDALVLSGDNTRIIGSSDVPSLDFHTVPSP